MGFEPPAYFYDYSLKLYLQIDLIEFMNLLNSRIMLK